MYVLETKTLLQNQLLYAPVCANLKHFLHTVHILESYPLSSSIMFKVDSSRTGRFLPHSVVIWGGVRPREENLRLVPVQSTGPTGEKDGREFGEILQLLCQHV